MEDTATGSLTRTIRCIDGNLAATTAKTGGTILQLVNLHGDVALALSADTALVPTVLDSDEYGNARTGQAAARYSWAGGKQRSDETLTGLTLMGVRLYDASTGRFLQTDPVVGGNENSYVYPADPIRMYELTGMYRVYWGWSYVTITLNSRENNNLAAGGVGLPPRSVDSRTWGSWDRIAYYSFLAYGTGAWVAGLRNRCLSIHVVYGYGWNWFTFARCA